MPNMKLLMKKNNAGFTTFVVIVGVLGVIVLFTLSVAASGYSNIKKTQNLVIEIKDKTIAKAGLDCGIAVFNQKELDINDIPAINNELNECEAIDGIDSVMLDVNASGWLMASKSGFAQYGALIVEKVNNTGAFKTAGNLHLKGGNSWVPAKGKLVNTYENDNQNTISVYECTAIISGGDVIIDTNNGTDNDPFSSNLLKTNFEECASGYSTVVSTGKEMKNDILVNNSIKADDERFEKDILYQQGQMDLFKDFFGKDKKNKNDIEELKTDFIYMSTEGTTTLENGDLVSNVSLCGKKISKARALIKKNTDKTIAKIWIEGDCDLSQVTNDIDFPMFLVFEDGAVIYNGSSGVLNVSLFQFTHDREMFLDSWLGVVTDSEGNALEPAQYKCKQGAFYSTCLEYAHPDRLGLMDLERWKNLPFLFHGSFESKGNYVVDIASSTSYVMGSFKPGYDSSIANEVANTFIQPYILKGSIHEF